MKPFRETFYSTDLKEHEAILRASGCEQGRVYCNDTYQVVVRPVDKGLTMLSIRRIDREVIHDWRELQAIKNMLTGPEREAIEVYPMESRKVDLANQYYLWVLPEGERVGVGFDERQLCDESILGSKQRPFDDPDEKAEARANADRIRARMLDHLRKAGVSEAQIARQRATRKR